MNERKASQSTSLTVLHRTSRQAELNNGRVRSQMFHWNKFLNFFVCFLNTHNSLLFILKLSSGWENYWSSQTFQWPHEQKLLEPAEFHPPNVFFLPPNVQCLLGIVSADWWAAAPEEEPPSPWWAEDGPCPLQPFLAKIRCLTRPAAVVYLKLFKGE